MASRRILSLAAAAIVFGGGAVLAKPAAAAPLACTVNQWERALALASYACDDGGASVVASCVDGRLIVTEIYCY